jgi:ribosomal protein S18 acetylase RimI-like enzyme
METKNILVADEWLSQRLNKPVFSLPTTKFLSENLFRLKQELQAVPLMAYAKVSVQKTVEGMMLQDMGFRVIDTQVEMQRPLRTFDALPTSVVPIRWALDSDRDEVVSLAAESFHVSRFHLDPLIDNKQADQIKKGWAESFFLNQRGDEMILACEGKSIIGFASLIKLEDSLRIDLIAVKESHRGKQIAEEMMTFAEYQFGSWFEGRPMLSVGVQLANSSSLALYQRMGFTIRESLYVMHIHQDDV